MPSEKGDRRILLLSSLEVPLFRYRSSEARILPCVGLRFPPDDAPNAVKL